MKSPAWLTCLEWTEVGLLLITAVIFSWSIGFVRRIRAGLRGEEGDLPMDTMKGYTDHALWGFNKATWGVLVSWCAFYVIRGIGLNDPWQPFLLNVCQNITSWCLIYMYAMLATPGTMENGVGKGKEYRLIWIRGWALIFLIVTAVELLTDFRQHFAVGPPEARYFSFNLFSGISQGLALFLLLGRLEDSVIWDHITPETRLSDEPDADWISLDRGLLIAGYVFAGLQCMYPMLDQPKYADMEAWLILIAFVLKACLIVLVFRLSRSKHERPSALQHYLYETGRFTTEELLSYERAFMRRHVNPNFRRSQTDTGYLGLDHQRLNAYKRARWGIARDQEGLWVTDVYPGSPAMRAGLRPRDYITHVRHHSLGPFMTLGEALEGTKSGEEVKIVFLRPSTDLAAVNGDIPSRLEPAAQLQCSVTLQAYDQLRHRRTVRLSRPFFGLKLRYNRLSAGVHVYSVEEGKEADIVAIYRPHYRQRHAIPDQHTLRQLRTFILPGEEIHMITAEGRAFNMKRYGPADDRTCASWQIPYSDMLPAKLELVQETENPEDRGHVLKEITERYADRFAHHRSGLYEMDPSLRDVHPHWASSPASGVVHVFDEKFELLFEYWYEEHEIRNMSDWPVWNRVIAGVVHVFVGHGPSLVNDEFDRPTMKSTAGVLCTLRLRRDCESNR